MEAQELLAFRAKLDERKMLTEDGVDYWRGRDLQPLLGYDRWENFAMQEVLRLLPREEGDVVSSEQLPRHGSAMAKTRELLLETGKPMHITDILKGIGKENTKSQRLSVSGSLRSYARKGQVFTREGGNVFGLVEFQTSNGNGRSPREVPPKGFGLSSEEEAA